MYSFTYYALLNEALISHNFIVVYQNLVKTLVSYIQLSPHKRKNTPTYPL